jgi:hypothetical protein
MKWCVSISLFLFCTGVSVAQLEVPGSASPDGKVALYYRHSSSQGMDGGYELNFRDRQSRAILSADLIPDVPPDLTTESAMGRQDSAILLGGIGAQLEAHRRHILWNPAFSSFVTWSPDSHWVSIEGGAHKFWRDMIYHSINGRFEQVRLPDRQFAFYFESHKNDQVAERGAAVAIRKISARDYDYPNVCWLENGRPAINAYPYLLRDADYLKLTGHDLFFVLDAHTNPASITGFCR